jgi:hypothetical protein
MTQILYYANKDTTYFLKGEEVNKYYIQKGREKIELIGNEFSLIKAGLLLETFYTKNSSKTELKNCSPELKGKGFRSLSESEETLLWLGINIKFKDK